MSETDEAAALAAAHATVPEALPLNELTLIGLINGAEGATALLRSARGGIARVAVGDAAFGVTITAIGTEQVILTDRWGRTQSMDLPS